MYEDKSKQGTEPWRAPKKTPVAPDRGYKYLDMDGDPTETRKAGGPAALPKKGR